MTLLFTPYTINDPVGIIILISLISLTYYYFWYASVDLIKMSDKYKGDNFEKVKWITYIPIVNYIFANFVAYIYFSDQVVEKFDKFIEQYRENMVDK